MLEDRRRELADLGFFALPHILIQLERLHLLTQQEKDRLDHDLRRLPEASRLLSWLREALRPARPTRSDDEDEELDNSLDAVKKVELTPDAKLIFRVRELRDAMRPQADRYFIPSDLLKHARDPFAEHAPPDPVVERR